MPKIDIEFEIFCEKHGEALKISKEPILSGIGVWRIEVKTCKECSEEANDDGYNEGYEEGEQEGFDSGYSEGKLEK